MPEKVWMARPPVCSEPNLCVTVLRSVVPSESKRRPSAMPPAKNSTSARYHWPAVKVCGEVVSSV